MLFKYSLLFPGAPVQLMSPVYVRIFHDHLLSMISHGAILLDKVARYSWAFRLGMLRHENVSGSAYAEMKADRYSGHLSFCEPCIAVKPDLVF